QAEDGIRDYKVTGVQTCALPISLMVLAKQYHYLIALQNVLHKVTTSLLLSQKPCEKPNTPSETKLRQNEPKYESSTHTKHQDLRSEERRVGKECRLRKTQYN